MARGGLVKLRDGYSFTGLDGKPVSRLINVRIAVEGGFLHIRLPQGEMVEIVSAPALNRVVYNAD